MIAIEARRAMTMLRPAFFQVIAAVVGSLLGAVARIPNTE
jgi:hypothetical protein